MNELAYVYGKLMLEIVSTLFITPKNTDISTNLLGITTAQYNSMAIPYRMLKSAEKNFGSFSLMNSYIGYKETEIAIILVKQNPGFTQFLSDHGDINSNFEKFCLA